MFISEATNWGKGEEMREKRIGSKNCDYESFQIEQKNHSFLAERKTLLGVSIEYQVNEAAENFFKKRSHELKGLKDREIVYRGRTFKFKHKLHEIFMLRRKLLGQNKDWQMNKAIEEYEKENSAELLKVKRKKEKEIEEERKIQSEILSETKKEGSETGIETKEEDKETGTEIKEVEEKKEEGSEPKPEKVIPEEEITETKKEEKENENTEKEQENEQGDSSPIPTIPTE